MRHHGRLVALAGSTLLVGCTDNAVTSPDVTATKSQRYELARAPMVIMSGLNSPRQLAFGPEGALYVAEAGTGVVNGPCVTVARGRKCYSGTASISRWWKGSQERIATGLPSIVIPAINDIGGANDIAFQGRGNMFVTSGWGADPAARAGFGARGGEVGALLRVTPNGAWRVVADVSAFEQASNPAGGPVDSNPYGVLAEGNDRYVTDAGGNSLLHVDVHGEVSLVAVFPSTVVPPLPFPFPRRQSEAVPTEVTRGPDGALYVSTLSGVPFTPGVARIYRVVPGAAPTVHVDGLTQVTDHAWGPDGSLYVTQYASTFFFGGPGSVVRIAPNGARSTVIGGLAGPTGVVVDDDGALYVTNKSASVGGGEVLRIAP